MPPTAWTLPIGPARRGGGSDGGGVTWHAPRAAPWRWRDRWNGPALPELVRIRIVFSHGEGRHWPDIVVAPLRAPRAG
jgi:hypothetical protein